MAFQEIDTVTDHGTYRGDPAQTAFNKANANFRELFGSAGLNNLLFNPSLGVNQRVFAGGAFNPNVFAFDRWFGGSVGANITVSNGVINHVAGSYCQVIEAPSHVLGTTVCVSVGDLSGGNLTVTVGGVSGIIQPGAGRRSVNILAPGSTPSGNLKVELSGTALTYRDVMIVRADQLGRFDARSFPLELSLCQRYYEKSFAMGVAPSTGAVGSTVVGTALNASVVRTSTVRFAVPKRAAPNISLFTSANANAQTAGKWALYNGSVWNTGSTWSVLQVTNNGFLADGTFGSGLTPFGAYAVDGNWAAESELTS